MFAVLPCMLPKCADDGLAIDGLATELAGLMILLLLGGAARIPSKRAIKLDTPAGGLNSSSSIPSSCCGALFIEDPTSKRTFCCATGEVQSIDESKSLRTESCCGGGHVEGPPKLSGTPNLEYA